MSAPCSDSIVESVVAKFRQRSLAGVGCIAFKAGMASSFSENIAIASGRQSEV